MPQNLTSSSISDFRLMRVADRTLRVVHCEWNILETERPQALDHLRCRLPARLLPLAQDVSAVSSILSRLCRLPATSPSVRNSAVLDVFMVEVSLNPSCSLASAKKSFLNFRVVCKFSKSAFSVILDQGAEYFCTFHFSD